MKTNAEKEGPAATEKALCDTIVDPYEHPEKTIWYLGFVVYRLIQASSGDVDLRGISQKLSDVSTTQLMLVLDWLFLLEKVDMLPNGCFFAVAKGD